MIQLHRIKNSHSHQFPQGRTRRHADGSSARGGGNCGRISGVPAAAAPTVAPARAVGGKHGRQLFVAGGGVVAARNGAAGCGSAACHDQSRCFRARWRVLLSDKKRCGADYSLRLRLRSPICSLRSHPALASTARRPPEAVAAVAVAATVVAGASAEFQQYGLSGSQFACNGRDGLAGLQFACIGGDGIAGLQLLRLHLR